MVILAVLCGAIIFNSVFIGNKLSDISELLKSLPADSEEVYEDSENYDKYKDTVLRIDKLWEKTEIFSQITISHNENEKLTEALISMKSYYLSNELTEYLNYLELSKSALEHIQSHERFTLKRIF